MVLSRAVHVVCLALAFALCCVQAGYAQAPDDAVALWRLTNPSGGSAVLMGTVHLLPNDDSWADKRLRKAVKQADLLVIEAKTTGKDEAKVKAFALERGFRPIGAPALADTLSPEDATRLRQAEGALNIPVGMTARMQPWFAALNLTLASVMQQGFSAESGAESWLTDRFEKDGE
ncbi:MAG: TraB/GumN family protein, partial [Pseudomonadota bacterium]